jgi:hypothetical protein
LVGTRQSKPSRHRLVRVLSSINKPLCSIHDYRRSYHPPFPWTEKFSKSKVSRVGLCHWVYYTSAPSTTPLVSSSTLYVLSWHTHHNLQTTLSPSPGTPQGRPSFQKLQATLTHVLHQDDAGAEIVYNTRGGTRKRETGGRRG